MPLAQAEAAVASVTAAAAGEGLDFHLDRSLRSNTFDAHRLVHLAADHGLQDAAKERFMRAYFSEGEPVGDRDDAGPARRRGRPRPRRRSSRCWPATSYADAVRADEAEARALGITGVPFFVVDRKYGVSGAQPADQLLAVLERAWSERSPLTLVGSAGWVRARPPAARTAARSETHQEGGTDHAHRNPARRRPRAARQAQPRGDRHAAPGRPAGVRGDLVPPRRRTAGSWSTWTRAASAWTTSAATPGSR